MDTCVNVSRVHVWSGVGLLPPAVTLSVTFWGTAQLFSQRGRPSLHSHQQCLHILTLIVWLFYDSHPSACEVVSLCGFVCMSRGIHDAERLSTCSLVIYGSSLGKHLFTSLTRFCFELFVVQFFTCSGYKSLTGYMASQYVLPFHGSLDCFSWCPLQHRSFTFWSSPIYLSFSFVACTFSVTFKEPLPKLRLGTLVAMFSYEFYSISSYTLVFDPFWVIFYIRCDALLCC